MAHKTMIDVGKEVRYNRIINPETGKMVLIPLDHGILLGPMSGIEHPEETIRSVVAGGADAVIFNAGIASKVYPAYMNRCGAIFNLINAITDGNDLTLINTVEYAVRNGADAVSVQVMVGSPSERHMVDQARIVADACSRWGMPLLAMMYPTDELLAERGKSVELLAARAGAELGADIVKTSYTGDPESFKTLVDGCPVPLVIAGGPKKETMREFLEMVDEAMQCGAAGVALGRNVWQSPDVTKTTAALADIVHRGKGIGDIDWL